MPVGGSGVANQVQTSNGRALGVVAIAHTGYGDDVGGGGVVDLYITPSGTSYLLLESGGFLLQEDGSKILLE